MHVVAVVANWSIRRKADPAKFMPTFRTCIRQLAKKQQHTWRFILTCHVITSVVFLNIPFTPGALLRGFQNDLL